MVRKLLRIALPVLLLAGAALGGAAAGDMLRRPPPEGGEAVSDGQEADAQADADPAATGASAHDGKGGQRTAHDGDLAWLKFPQQFFVPIVRGGTLRAVMILDLSLEMPAAQEEAVSRQEHRLRDALLRSLLMHANTGGFDGNFTAGPRLALLRETLLAEARKVAGPGIMAVLIGDIAMQEQ